MLPVRPDKTADVPFIRSINYGGKTEKITAQRYGCWGRWKTTRDIIFFLFSVRAFFAVYDETVS